jgi:signal transduction histidine kinase
MLSQLWGRADKVPAENRDELLGIACDWAWRVDHELRLTEWRPLHDGVVPEGPIGRLATEFMDFAADGERGRELAQDVAARRAFRDVVYQESPPLPDGSRRWIRSSGRPLFAADGKFLGYIGVAVEITTGFVVDTRRRDRKKRREDSSGRPGKLPSANDPHDGAHKAEVGRQDLEHKLMHAQRLESLGTLAGGISHEINNALMPVLSMTEIVADSLPQGSVERGHLELALRGAERVRKLVDQIQTFVRRMRPVEGQSFDLASIVTDALPALRANLPPEVALVAEIEPVPALRGDPGQFESVLTNLISNAVHAIGEMPGTVTIGLCPVDNGQTIHLSVADTGRGMDDATAQRVFEPFFTTKEVGQGTGLGLSILHGIVVGHGGTVTVHSAPGKGARFDLFLPAAGTAS